MPQVDTIEDKIDQLTDDIGVSLGAFQNTTTTGFTLNQLSPISDGLHVLSTGSNVDTRAILGNFQ